MSGATCGGEKSPLKCHWCGQPIVCGVTSILLGPTEEKIARFCSYDCLDDWLESVCQEKVFRREDD